MFHSAGLKPFHPGSTLSFSSVRVSSPQMNLRLLISTRSSWCRSFPLWKYHGRPTAGRSSSRVTSHFQPHQYRTSLFKFRGWFETVALRQTAVLWASRGGSRTRVRTARAIGRFHADTWVLQAIRSRKIKWCVCLFLVNTLKDFISEEKLNEIFK